MSTSPLPFARNRFPDHVWVAALTSVLTACGGPGIQSNPTTTTTAPHMPDPRPEILRVVHQAECEAVAAEDDEARFSYWDRNAEVRFERLADEPETVVSLRGDKARARLGAGGTAPTRDDDNAPECLVVDDLEARLAENRTLDVATVIRNAPSEASARFRDLARRRITVQVDTIEVHDDQAVVSLRRITNPAGLVDAMRATLRRTPDGWKITEATSRILEALPPLRDHVVFDAEFYGRADALVAATELTGDHRCHLRALDAASRHREAYALLQRLTEAQRTTLADVASSVVRAVGHQELMASEQDPEGRAGAVAQMLIGTSADVCGQSYAAHLGVPTDTAPTAALRVCSESDVRSLEAAASGTGTLTDDLFCAPAPDELQAAVDDLARAISSCAGDAAEVLVNVRIDESGVAGELGGATGLGVLAAIPGFAGLNGLGAADPLSDCVRASLATVRLRPFRLRPAEPSGALFADRGVAGFIAHLMSILRSVLAEQAGAASGPPGPAWALRLTLYPGATPRVEPAPAGLF